MDFEQDEIFNASEEEDNSSDAEEDDDDEDDEFEDNGLNAALIDVEPSVANNMSNDRDGLDSEEFIFHVLTTEQIMLDMIQCIEEVDNLIQKSPTITRILLNHFNWDKERLIERYFGGDKESLFNEAHIIDPSKARNQQNMVRHLIFLHTFAYMILSTFFPSFHPKSLCIDSFVLIIINSNVLITTEWKLA